MIDAGLRVDGRDVWLAGAVRGRVDEVAELLRRLAAFGPRAIGLGLSPDELAGLTDHFVLRPFEPLVPLTASETAEVVGLAAYGEVRVPHPAYVGVLEWARGHDVPVEPLEVSDEQYSRLFGDHISYVELVRRTLAERRLTRRPPAGRSADEYAVRWEEGATPGRGSRAFLTARAHAIGEAARRLATRVGRSAVIVDRERFDAVRAALTAG